VGTHDIIAEGTGVEPYASYRRPGLNLRPPLSEMRPHRRTPGPSVFCAVRVMPGGPLENGLPPEVSGSRVGHAAPSL